MAGVPDDFLLLKREQMCACPYFRMWLRPHLLAVESSGNKENTWGMAKPPQALHHGCIMPLAGQKLEGEVGERSPISLRCEEVP